MSNILDLLALNIRQRIRTLGWTQHDLADKTGILYPQLNRYLTGKTVPGITVLDKFATALNCDPRELLRPENEQHSTEFQVLQSLLANLKIHGLPESFVTKLNELNPDKRNSLLKIFETQVDMFLQNTKPKD